MWSPITRTCNIFPQPRSSCGTKHIGPNTSRLLTSSYSLGPGSLVPNLTHLLNDGMSILKREVATMPVLTHRTFVQCLHLNNWHCLSELPPQQSQALEDPSLWMPSGSMPISK